jgi:small subunit ribosomal protein S10
MELKRTQNSVRLESFNHEILVSSCQKIVNILQNTSLNSIGVIATRKRIYCVLRSPHVDKDAREHFEIRVHKRILEIYYDSEVPIFDLLSELTYLLVFFTVYVYHKKVSFIYDT